MKKNHLVLTLAVDYLAMALVAAAAVCLNRILDASSMVRILLPSERTAILIGFYCCLPFILLALWQVRRLLVNLHAKEVFTVKNVKLLASIRNCCLGIFLLCLAAGCFFYPLLLVAAILGFLGLMIHVLKQVMAQAVAIREENDLTV